MNRLYGGDNDAFLDGLNVEISNHLTPVRRPGSSVYNSQIFPKIDNFYEFRLFNSDTETIKVVADTASVIYDATGPSTKTSIFTKSTGAGEAYFQSVGNTLYIGDGVDQKQWIESALTWKASTLFNDGDFIIDRNNDIQEAVGGFTSGITNIAISGNVLTVTLDPLDPNLPDDLNFLIDGVRMTFAGLGAATFLNGQTVLISGTTPNALGANVFFATFIHGDYASTPDTGTASTGTGITGTTEPIWDVTLGDVTTDGGAQWVNRGFYIKDWGIVGPAKAPTVAQTALPQTLPAWAANTYYSTSYLILDPANHAQKVTGFGTTGSSQPAFDDAGGTTSDGTVVWSDQGSATYLASTVYAAGAYIVQTATDGTQYFYKTPNGGTTGVGAPPFSPSLGASVTDNGIQWVNVGIVQTWSSIASSDISGNFGIIPVMGGGTVVIGVGQGATGLVALPTGYSTSNMIAWNTPGSSSSGSQISGVFQANTSGGTLTASFQNRSSGFGFSAASNWAAAAWSSGAAVTLSSVGGLQYAAFQTAMGDNLVLCAGPMTNGATVAIPSGSFSAAQFTSIVGLSGTANTGNGMNIAQICSLDPTLKLTTQYNDNDGNTWTGSANVFGIFWATGGTVTTQAVTGGAAILIPTSSSQKLAVIQATAANGANFGLPAGFGSASVIATCAMSSGTLNGSHVGHGWNCSVSGTTYTGQYLDSSGIYTVGGGNIFALVGILDTTPVSPNQNIADGLGDQQTISVSGVSGTAAPSWSTKRGSTTVDNFASWTNTGTFAAASTLPWVWAYAYKNSITGNVSNASPVSSQITLNAGNFVQVQGSFSTDPQVDTVIIYRSVQGGSSATLLEDDEIPNNPAGGTWSFQDTKPDTSLLVETLANISPLANPPAVGMTKMTYHLGRIWGVVNNSVYFSAGPDATNGNGNEQFPPANVFVFPDSVSRLYATTQGLFVFTVSDVYLISGTTTANFFSVPFLVGVGLQNYNAWTVNGATVYMFSSDSQILSFDLGTGVSEPGFAIGDQFLQAPWIPATARLTYHIAGSADKGLYVSDFSTGWYRLYPTPAPETGLTWAPFASIVGGISQVQSVETSPGVHNLLIGPTSFGGPILKRDSSVFTDNGSLFHARFLLGCIVLAQPGQVAELVFITTDCVATGVKPTLSVRLDEINATAAPPFEVLTVFGPDPPQLSPSATIYSQRFYLSQTQKPAICRNIQISVDWGFDTFRNEMLSLTLFGGFQNELA
jgi:hypothetical protein